MDLTSTYEQVTQKMSQISFEDLWPGFRRYEFALYNDETVVLNGNSFPKTDQFIANTSILYEGRYIAIWQLTEEIDITILTSKIIHEMFHAYQMEQKDSRFANELEAVCTYSYSPEYLQIKYNENLILADLAVEFSAEKLQDFLRLRKIRQHDFSYEYNYENCIEAIEGSAQYVEMQVLKVLDQTKYEKLQSHLIQNIRNIKSLIPARIICYDIGAIFLDICMQNHLPLDLSLGKTSEIFYGGLVMQTPYKKQEMAVLSDVAEFCNEDRKWLREKIDKMTAECEVIRGDFELLGFNVYSARFLDGYMYTTYFLMYKGEKTETLYGNFLFKFENHRITEIYKEK